ncbi:MAG: carboxypeptidase-like regulatory domain-containing protein [Ginsengibacter sp.]
MRQLMLLFFVLTLFQTSYAQESVVISGTIRSKTTGESIIGATITSKEFRETILTNEYGFYSFKLPKGEHTLIISHSGMKTAEFKIALTKNMQKDVYLEGISRTLDEVVISAPI